MIRLLIEKELREQIGSPKFAMTFGICSILILVSFFIGARNFTVSMEQHKAAIAENARQMEGSSNWLGITHTVYLPPQPLSAMVSGISNDTGRSIRISAAGEIKAVNSRFNEEPILAVFRFLDLEFLFSVVLSLFAVMFAYDAVNGEKERGTLRLALSNPISRSTFILGKLLGTFLSLFVPLLIPVALGILLLPLLGVYLDGDELMRLVLILGVGFLFFASFLALSVMVSASTRHSSYSFLIMLIVWISSVLILPRTAVLLSARLVDVPTVDLVEKQKREYASQLISEDRAKYSNFKPDPSIPPTEILGEFSKFMGTLAKERDALITEFNARVNEDRENRQREQERLAMNLARLSPATSMSLAMTNLAGTSIAMKDRFSDQAREYQSVYRAFMAEKNPNAINMGGGTTLSIAFSAGSSGPSVINGNESEKKINPGELPVFEYRDVTLRDVSASAVPDIAILIGFGILFFVGAFLQFLRFDVR